MDWLKDYYLWIMLSTLATAIFTGGAFVIAWKVYQEAQVAAGKKRPIVISNPIQGQPSFGDRESLMPNSPYESRAAHIFIFNQSDVSQTVTFSDIKIKGQKVDRFYPFGSGDCVLVAPSSGGNLPIYFINEDWLNLSDKKLEALVIGWKPLKCQLDIHAQTLSGNRMRCKIKTELINPNYSP